MSALGSARRLFVTASYLRPTQVAAQLRHRILGMRAPGVVGLRARRRCHVPAFLGDAAVGLTAGCARFIGEADVDLNGPIDWRSPEASKLWRYNLHYFDYLHGPGLSADRKAALIDDWITANPPGSPDGWEGYPASLRAVNWIKYFGSEREPQPAWIDSLALQLAWLERNLEYHLLANHLLKNAKALVFGGAYFDGAEADTLLRKGTAMMREQGREQVLPDGGHYERSVMYHAIALEDYLDVVNLLRANPGLASAEAGADLDDVARRALHYLADVLAGDGEMPLFNDAAFGITPSPQALLDYGRRVLDEAPPRTTHSPLRICKPDTGYFGYRHGGDSLLIDCGPGGPDYQPGHTHADTLSYELCIAGQRIVVDSGVFNYENDELRHYLRGTAAHNTVRVDEADQSEVWGAFRVARRARPLRADLSPLQPDGSLAFVGAHDGYRRLRGRVTHERRITANVSGTWDIADRITGSGSHLLESFVHFHPVCALRQTGEGEVLVSIADRDVARLTTRGAVAVAIRPGAYCPEFGRKLENQVLVMHGQFNLPAELGYTIRKL